jgi:hypothetical protein
LQPIKEKAGSLTASLLFFKGIQVHFLTKTTTIRLCKNPNPLWHMLPSSILSFYSLFLKPCLKAFGTAMPAHN